MVFISDNCDALYDALRAKKNCTTDEWAEFNGRLHARTDIHSGVLRAIVAEVEKREPQKRERENTTGIRSDNDCSAEEDSDCVILWATNKRAAVQADNCGAYQDPGPSNYRRVTSVHEAQPEKKDKGMNVVQEEVEGDTNDVVEKPGSSNESCTGVAQSQPGKKNKNRGARWYADFRTRVIEVLKTPYDRDEYKRQWQTIQAGKWFHSYPDLRSVLQKNRFNRAKCSAILHGFFFWVLNNRQEGSFKPWKDEQCLNVAPT